MMATNVANWVFLDGAFTFCIGSPYVM
jgi:hypothetical protein